MTGAESGDDRGVTRFHREPESPGRVRDGASGSRNAGRGVLECRRAGDFVGWYVGLCSPVPKCLDLSYETDYSEN